MKPVINIDFESGKFINDERVRGIQIGYIEPLTEEYKAVIMELASILGKGEPITQIEIDSLSMLVPQESPKKVDNRFWARKQADKKLRKFK